MAQRPTVVVELAANEQHARDLSAGGIFVPGCGLPLNSECDLVVRSATAELRLLARIVFLDPRSGAGLELVGFGPELKERLATLMAAEGASEAEGRGLDEPGPRADSGIGAFDEWLDEWAAEEAAASGTGGARRGGALAQGSGASIELRGMGSAVGERFAQGSGVEIDLGEIDEADAVRFEQRRDGEPAQRHEEIGVDAPSAEGPRVAYRFEDASGAEIRIDSDSDSGGSGDGGDDGDDLELAVEGDEELELDDADLASEAAELESAAGDPGDGVEDVDDAADAAEDAEGGMDETGEDDGSDGAGPSRRRIPANVHERLRHLPLAQQIKKAHTGELQERIVLERMYGKTVWEALLRNPRLTAPEVARIARMGSLPRTLLELIVNNGAWLQIPEVRRALLANRRLQTDQILRVLRLLPKHELRLAAVQTAYPHPVRDAAKRMLKEQP